MSWASIANNQCISFNNLQDAVTTSVFVLKAAIPVSLEQITKTDADTYVYIDTCMHKCAREVYYGIYILSIDIV